jgi:hypothetical protein
VAQWLSPPTRDRIGRRTTIEWAHALGAFFFLLLGFELDSSEQPKIARKSGRATINEALAASTEAFKKGGNKRQV